VCAYGALVVFVPTPSAYHGASNRLAPTGHFSKTKNRLLQIFDLQFARLGRDRLMASGRRASQENSTACGASNKGLVKKKI
jgi:hypothetical protein